jgi:diguanylate cyclase (GGDEF)-like protein/PAS domain S-box-containing protein
VNEPRGADPRQADPNLMKGLSELRDSSGPRALLCRLFPVVVALLAIACLCAAPAGAVDAIRVNPDTAAIDMTKVVQYFHSPGGDTIQISTAPGADGIVRRIAVKARTAGSRPDWIAFALNNDSDQQIDRLLVAPHSRLTGSQVVWPDLGSTRITAVTASEGSSPERQPASDADIFLITLDPGATVTYVAELATPDLPQLYLWDSDAYKEKVNGLTLYRGIVIGIIGLLALFLTIIVVVKGAVMFPAAAALAWSVFVYIAIEFGFVQKLTGLPTEGLSVYQAAAEATLAATTLVFLFAYLNLNRWHVRYSHIMALWLLFLIALIGLAAVNAPVAAGVARISLAAVASIGFLLIVFLAIHQRYDRAIALIPTWLMLLAWVVAAGFVVTGQIDNDLAAPMLLGGLALIVFLIGLTVMQHAFSGGGYLQGAPGTTERKALALTGSGDAVYDWDVSADKVHVGHEVEAQLGLARGALGGPAAGWLDVMHPFDRESYRATLDNVLEQRRGRIQVDFRLRDAEGQYHWFQLKARPVIGDDNEVVRIAGTLADVTEARQAQERILHDAVHDNLTGLPNRELFLDRVANALVLSRTDEAMRPTLITIDIDRFKQVNETVGLSVGDSVLLTLSRRLERLMRPQDTLSRISGDEFAVLLFSEREAEAITLFADGLRRALAAPLPYKDREIALTTSLGLALVDRDTKQTAEEFLRNAELAMLHAKRLGGDRIEVFKPSLRIERPDRLLLVSDLRQAIDRDEIRIVFQPIVRLEDRTIAGFEALMRWDHPRLGRLPPKEFISLAEENGLISDLGVFALEHTVRELAAWQRALDVDPPIFASVNISSRQIFRHDLVQEVKAIIGRVAIAPNSLKLELTESLIMENPEYATQILTRLRDLGAGIALDDFGTGYSSLSYLHRFPLDTVKIDQSFVHQSGHASDKILRAIVSLARDLGLSTVAEGAETESEIVLLSQLGCDYAQGFIFGQPLSADEARRLVGATQEAA